jgi:hypothetical protein
MVNDYSSGREACQAKITCTQRLSWLLGMSALDATKFPDINFQTKSVWFDPKFFSWSVRASPGVVPGKVSWVSLFLDVQCAHIGLQNRSDEVNGRTSSQNGRTLVRNHAQSIVACDLLVAVTRPVANSLCVPPGGGRYKAHRALQGHRTGNGDRDLAAASRSDSERSFLPFPDP